MKDKIAVITGAGRGIGAAIAQTYAKAGMKIAICARSERALQDVAASIETECLAVVLDVADPIAVETFCAQVIAQFGKVDVLVNNAGAYGGRGRLEDSDPEIWWQTQEINIRGPYLMTRHLLPAMGEGAKIINLTSGKGMAPGANSASYHVSKAGLNMMTTALANEMWERKIDVNLLVPGPTATVTLSQDDPASGLTSDDILAKFEGKPPPGLPAWERLKHPQEVADLALQMASYPMGGPNGQVFSLARRPL